MSMSPKEQKVYQGVLQEIRRFIDNNHLQPGDKLPSERELADKLQTGRSSIREAFRALELLGLIETRHGEGTFLGTYRSYQTVELLASFILQKRSTGKDLFFTKKLLEQEVARLAFIHISKQDTDHLEAIMEHPELDPSEKHVAFFQCLFKKTGNLLLEKIWLLLEEFSHSIYQSHYDKMFYKELVQLYLYEDYESIETLFKVLTLNSVGEE